MPTLGIPVSLKVCSLITRIGLPGLAHPPVQDGTSSEPSSLDQSQSLAASPEHARFLA